MLVNKYNPNFIVIEKEVIREAIDSCAITKVGENYRGNGNIYYRVNSIFNTILMNVKDNKFILIDQTVKVEYNGTIIDLVPILSSMSFYINKTRDKERNNRERVKGGVSFSGITRSVPIERIIRSIMIHGGIQRLPKDYHIHHESKVYDNRGNCCDYRPEREHTHRESHMKGEYIDSIQKFNKLMFRINL